MREVKRNNPGAQVKLDYDKVEVGSKSYVFDYEEGRVMQKSYGGRGQIQQPPILIERPTSNNISTYKSRCWHLSISK